jgi:hypothetical protein|tara:strand:+ start:339 stop:689 length:351 start_codon:yes stop_codon:yes gene_type:complete
MAGFKVGSDQVAAAAWINFDGTGSFAIRDSYNVSGLTDNGTGDYTIVWDVNFTNTNYAYQTFSHYGGSSNDMGYLGLYDSGQATGQLRLFNLSALNGATTSTAGDCEQGHVAAFGN